MMGAGVSVALCTHDGAAFIAQQVRSIAAQTVAVSEVVIGDDASSDDTVQQATAILQSAGIPVTVLTADSALGVTANFERTILACRSEFVALSDQDDVWHPDRIARGLAAFAAEPGLSLVNADADLVDERGLPLGLRLFDALEIGPGEITGVREDAFAMLMRRNLVTGATTMLRRSLADVATPFGDGWVHDEWLAIVAAGLDQLGTIDEPLIDYRQHGRNQIGARLLGPVGKVRRMLEPGALRSARLLRRAETLEARIGLIPGIPADRADAARRKVEHERMRSSLSSSRVRRIGAVRRELATGRYSEFGRGPVDAVRDLLQPLRVAR